MKKTIFTHATLTLESITTPRDGGKFTGTINILDGDREYGELHFLEKSEEVELPEWLVNPRRARHRRTTPKTRIRLTENRDGGFFNISVKVPFSKFENDDILDSYTDDFDEEMFSLFESMELLNYKRLHSHE